MWDNLKKTEKPIVLYGTGDGAEKIMRQLELRGIPVAGIFASDEFVRRPHKIFHGFEVLSYSEARERFGDMTVLVCFGSDRPDVIEKVRRIASEQDLYAPDVPVAGTEIFDRSYYELHKEKADRVRGMLADGQSRLVFDSVIEYKLSGRPDPLFSCETPDSELWELLFPGPDESYLDLGAYTGDTVLEFISAAGTYRDIYAFEPDARNFRKLTENLLPSLNCELFNIAAYSHKTELQFTKNTGRGNSAKTGKTVTVNADSVDSMLSGKRVTLVKIDVEGLEYEAVRGMEQLIRTQHPKMLIAAYHRSGDLWDIPKQVLGLYPEYKVFLRHSPCIPAWEVNYIFIPDNSPEMTE